MVTDTAPPPHDGKNPFTAGLKTYNSFIDLLHAYQRKTVGFLHTSVLGDVISYISTTFIAPNIDDSAVVALRWLNTLGAGGRNILKPQWQVSKITS